MVPDIHGVISLSYMLPRRTDSPELLAAASLGGDLTWVYHLTSSLLELLMAADPEKKIARLFETHQPSRVVVAVDLVIRYPERWELMLLNLSLSRESSLVNMALITQTVHMPLCCERGRKHNSQKFDLDATSLKAPVGHAFSRAPGDRHNRISYVGASPLHSKYGSLKMPL